MIPQVRSIGLSDIAPTVLLVGASCVLATSDNPLFIIRNSPKKYRKYREYAEKISDKKVAMGGTLPMAMNRAGKKISDKNMLA